MFQSHDILLKEHLLSCRTSFVLDGNGKFRLQNLMPINTYDCKNKISIVILEISNRIYLFGVHIQ